MRRLFIGFLALLPAVALAQRPDQLTRATSATGANDSLIIAACDSVRPTCRMRGVTAGEARKTILRGTATNDTAAATNIGYFMTHSTAIASRVLLSSATPINIDSLSLTAGDWDVSGTVGFQDSVAKKTVYQVGTDTVSATFQVASRSIQVGYGGHALGTDTASSAINSFNVPITRYTLASTTKVYLICSATFTINLTKCYGTIRARRVR